MKKIFTLLCAAAVSAASFAQDAYDPAEHTCFLAGTDNFCAASWDSSVEPLTYEAGVWSITKNATVTGQTIEVKVVYDGGWYGTPDGGNVQFSVSAACDVTVTFNPETNEVKVAGANVGGPVTAIDHIIACGSSTLLGSNWDNTDKNNLMEEIDDDYYQLVKTGIPAGIYEFKFAANDAWAIQWGLPQDVNYELGTTQSVCGEPNANIKFELPEGYTYTVTIILDLTNPDAPTVNVSAKEEGTADVKEAVYSIAGTMNGWNQADEATELTKTAEGVYSINMALEAGDYEFKVVKNHDWSVNYGSANGEFSTGVANVAGGDNAWFTLTAASNVTITLDLTAEPTITVAVANADADGIQAIEAAAKTAAIYNLAGQRVSKAARGIFVVNGKKVLK